MTKGRYPSIFKFVLIAVMVCAGGVSAQMVNPSIDKAGEPFSYFSEPTDVIGIQMELIDRFPGTNVQFLVNGIRPAKSGRACLHYCL